MTASEMEACATDVLAENEGTNRAYTNAFNAFKWWCANNSSGVFTADLVDDDAHHKAARFLQWAFLECRPGYVVWGKKAAPLGESSLGIYHSMLQRKWAAGRIMRAARNLPLLSADLKEDPMYKEIHRKRTAWRPPSRRSTTWPWPTTPSPPRTPW